MSKFWSMEILIAGTGNKGVIKTILTIWKKMSRYDLQGNRIWNKLALKTP
jgi:hypothetical protein